MDHLAAEVDIAHFEVCDFADAHATAIADHQLGFMFKVICGIEEKLDFLLAHDFGELFFLFGSEYIHDFFFFVYACESEMVLDCIDGLIHVSMATGLVLEEKEQIFVDCIRFAVQFGVIKETSEVC